MRTWEVIETVWDEDNYLELAGWADGWAHVTRYRVRGTTAADAANVVCARERVATLPREITLREVTP